VDIASKAAALPPVSVPSVVINQDVLFGNEQESILNQIEAGWYLPVKYGPQRSGINMAIAGPGASSQLPPPGSAAQPPGGQPQNPALPAGQPPNPALPAGQPPAPVPAGQQGLSSQDQQTLSIYVSAEINKMKQRAVKYVKDEILKLADRANYSRAEKKQLSQWFTQNDLQYIENPLDKNIFDTFRTQVQDPNFTARFQSLADAQQAFDNALQQLSLNNYLQQMINDIVHELETNVFPTSPMTPQQPQTQSAASAASAAQTAAAAQPASPSSTLTSTITSGLTGFKNFVSSGLQNIRGKVSGGPANPPSQQRQPSPPPATPMSPTAARPLINPQLSPTSQLAVAQKKGADIEYYWDPSTNTFVGEDKLLAMTDQARGQAIKSDKFRMKIDEIKPIIKKYAQNETFKGANLEALKVKLIKAMNSQQKSPGAAATAATGKGRKGKTDYSGPMEEPQTPRPKRSVGSAPRPRPRSSRGLPDESFEGFDDSANDLFMKPQPMQPKTELMMIENAHVPIMSGNKGLPKIYGMENKLKNVGYYKPKF
jgi:predicted HicB family RNase H-like nuclease